MKLCGTTSTADRDLAAEFGADFFGVVVEVSWSPRSRSLSEAQALLEGAIIPGVLLFCDAALERVIRAAAATKPFAVQLQGHEPPETVRQLAKLGSVEVWKTIHLPASGTGRANPAELARQARDFVAAGASKLLLDSVTVDQGMTKLGGTGLVHDWLVARELVASLPCPVWLSGGVSPANVRDALDQVRPYGVDLASGVESAKGKRDREKVRALMAAVQRWRKERAHSSKTG